MLTIFFADEVSRRTTLSKDGLTAGTLLRRRSCRGNGVVSIDARFQKNFNRILTYRKQHTPRR